MLGHKGHSLVTWVTIFTVIITGLAFISTPLKRTLTNKIWRLTDWYFWTSWGDLADQYKGDELVRSKSIARQQQNMTQREPIDTGIISKDFYSRTGDRSVSISTQPGTEVFLEQGQQPEDILKR
jgi:hypothetical protein